MQTWHDATRKTQRQPATVDCCVVTAPKFLHTAARRRTASCSLKLFFNTSMVLVARNSRVASTLRITSMCKLFKSRSRNSRPTMSNLLSVLERSTAVSIYEQGTILSRPSVLNTIASHIALMIGDFLCQSNVCVRSQLQAGVYFEVCI